MLYTLPVPSLPAYYWFPILEISSLAPGQLLLTIHPSNWLVLFWSYSVKGILASLLLKAKKFRGNLTQLSAVLAYFLFIDIVLIYSPGRPWTLPFTSQVRGPESLGFLFLDKPRPSKTTVPKLGCAQVLRAEVKNLRNWTGGELSGRASVHAGDSGVII